MARRMTGTGKRADSKNRQFERRVPRDVLDKVRGTPLVFTFPPDGGSEAFTINATIGHRVRVSLRAETDAVWVGRSAALTAHLERIYEAARRGPINLTARQIVAFSGVIYRAWREALREDPVLSTGEWGKVAETVASDRQGGFGAKLAIPLPDDRHIDDAAGAAPCHHTTEGERAMLQAFKERAGVEGAVSVTFPPKGN